MVVGVADHPELLERFHDLDAIRADGLVHPVVTEGVGGAHGVLGVPPSHTGEGVDDPEVGVDAESGDEEDLAAAIVGVDVAAVVEVPVARCRVPREYGGWCRWYHDGDGGHEGLRWVAGMPLTLPEPALRWPHVAVVRRTAPPPRPRPRPARGGRRRPPTRPVACRCRGGRSPPAAAARERTGARIPTEGEEQQSAGTIRPRGNDHVLDLRDPGGDVVAASVERPITRGPVGDSNVDRGSVTGRPSVLRRRDRAGPLRHAR